MVHTWQQSLASFTENFDSLSFQNGDDRLASHSSSKAQSGGSDVLAKHDPEEGASRKRQLTAASGSPQDVLMSGSAAARILVRTSYFRFRLSLLLVLTS